MRRYFLEGGVSDLAEKRWLFPSNYYPYWLSEWFISRQITIPNGLKTKTHVVLFMKVIWSLLTFSMKFGNYDTCPHQRSYLVVTSYY